MHLPQVTCSKYSLLQITIPSTIFTLQNKHLIQQRRLLILLLLVCTFQSLTGQDSISILKKQLKLEKDSIAKAALQHRIGNKYFNKIGNYDSALNYLHDANSFYKRTGSKQKEAKCLIKLCDIYKKQAQNIKSIYYNERALKIAKELKDTAIIVSCLTIRSFTMESKEAILVNKKIVQLCELSNNPNDKIIALSNIGNRYSLINMPDSTEKYHLECLKELNLHEDKRISAYTHFNLGSLYLEQKKFRKANKYLPKALQLFEEINNQAEVGWVIPELVKLYILWQEENPKEYQQLSEHPPLLPWLKQSEKTCNRTDDLGAKIGLEEAYTIYYKSNNNFKQTVEHQDKLIKLRERQSKKERIEAIAKFSEELKTADKEKEIIKLNAEKKIASATANRNKIIFFLILLGLLSSIYFIVKRIKYRNIKEQEERDKKFRTKLSSDLHDDVGTILTSLSMQSELLEMKTTDGNKGTVGKIADMSRDATRRMRDTVWAIDSRKDNIMDLAYRMIDFADDMLGAKDVEFQLQHNIEGKYDKISAELRQTIFLIFKEAVTNAAKYGTGELVTANLHKEKDLLKLTVQNEINETINTEAVSGLGLSNIEKRTQDINGSFALENKNNSFAVKLSFPL